MAKQITLELPDELYENAKRWAAITQQAVPEALTDALAVLLTPVYAAPELEEPIASLSDEEVLALSQTQMETAQGKRMDELLEKRRERPLTESELRELLTLMQIYHQLWLRQSEALVEAVRRGLREPLAP